LSQLVVFIHGLGSSGEKAFGKFPDLVRSDSNLHEILVEMYDFRSTKLRFPWQRRVPPIQTIADGLKSLLRVKYSDMDEVVLVGHSLGGLVVRQHILGEAMEGNDLGRYKLMLLAAPNEGADAARIGTLVSWRHNQLRQLCKDSDYLDSLNSSWGRLNLRDRVSATYVAAGLDTVVDKKSATLYWGADHETEPNKDHTSIARVDNRNDLVYHILKNLITHKAIPRQRVKSTVPDWITRINSAYSKDVSVSRLAASEPKVHVEGAFPVTPAQEKRIVKTRDSLISGGGYNDLHGLVTEGSVLQTDPMHFVIQTLDYATVSVLRSEGAKPQLLSASAVVVCPEKESIVLHKRANRSATYHARVHTLGGAFVPPSLRGKEADRSGPRSTVIRELFEEAQILVGVDDHPPIMIAKELSTGFVQVVYLGFQVSSSGLTPLSPNKEGTPFLVTFQDLPQFLRNPDWVPTGRAHVLAWLALGAPGAGKKPRFGNYTAAELFDIIVP
jgi:triacylglycerol esterase/lipase EstA (alpha/beta hydrolase family)